MTVTVYSRAKCVQCDATFRRLNKLNIPYNVVKVDEDDDALTYITQELGYQQVPVVTTDNDHWSGYRIDKLQGLIAERKAA